jgi:hypothetical protein
MKLEDFETAERLIYIRRRLINALAVLDDRPETKKVLGGVSGVADTGEYIYLSSYGDGSGEIVNLTGCYVAEEVTKATQRVLEEKLVVIEDEMKRIGIEF